MSLFTKRIFNQKKDDILLSVAVKSRIRLSISGFEDQNHAMDNKSMDGYVVDVTKPESRSNEKEAVEVKTAKTHNNNNKELRGKVLFI